MSPTTVTCRSRATRIHGALLGFFIIAGTTTGCESPAGRGRLVDILEREAVASRYSEAPAGVHGLTSSPAGDLYFSDSFGNLDTAHAVYRQPPPPATPVKLPISGQLPAGLLWHDGSFYVCDTAEHMVHRYDSTWRRTASWGATAPWSIAVMGDGALVTASASGSVERLLPNGQVEVLFDGLTNPFGVAAGADGTLWVSEQGGPDAPGRVTRRTLDGAVVEEVKAPFGIPEGLLVAGDGALWIADTGADRIYRHDGEGTQLATAQLRLPIVFAAAANGGVIVNGALDAAPEEYGLWQLVQ